MRLCLAFLSLLPLADLGGWAMKVSSPPCNFWLWLSALSTPHWRKSSETTVSKGFGTCCYGLREMLLTFGGCLWVAARRPLRRRTSFAEWGRRWSGQGAKFFCALFFPDRLSSAVKQFWFLLHFEQTNKKNSFVDTERRMCYIQGFWYQNDDDNDDIYDGDNDDDAAERRQTMHTRLSVVCLTWNTTQPQFNTHAHTPPFFFFFLFFFLRSISGITSCPIRR